MEERGNAISIINSIEHLSNLTKEDLLVKLSELEQQVQKASKEDLFDLATSKFLNPVLILLQSEDAEIALNSMHFLYISLYKGAVLAGHWRKNILCDGFRRTNGEKILSNFVIDEKTSKQIKLLACKCLCYLFKFKTFPQKLSEMVTQFLIDSLECELKIDFDIVEIAQLFNCFAVLGENFSSRETLQRLNIPRVFVNAMQKIFENKIIPTSISTSNDKKFCSSSFSSSNSSNLPVIRLSDVYLTHEMMKLLITSVELVQQLVLNRSMKNELILTMNLYPFLDSLLPFLSYEPSFIKDGACFASISHTSPSETLLLQLSQEVLETIHILLSSPNSYADIIFTYPSLLHKVILFSTINVTSSKKKDVTSSDFHDCVVIFLHPPSESSSFPVPSSSSAKPISASASTCIQKPDLPQDSFVFSPLLFQRQRLSAFQILLSLSEFASFGAILSSSSSKSSSSSNMLRLSSLVAASSISETPSNDAASDDAHSSSSSPCSSSSDDDDGRSKDKHHPFSQTPAVHCLFVENLFKSIERFLSLEVTIPDDAESAISRLEDERKHIAKKMQAVEEVDEDSSEEEDFSSTNSANSAGSTDLASTNPQLQTLFTSDSVCFRCALLGLGQLLKRVCVEEYRRKCCEMEKEEEKSSKNEKEIKKEEVLDEEKEKEKEKEKELEKEKDKEKEKSEQTIITLDEEEISQILKEKFSIPVLSEAELEDQRMHLKHLVKVLSESMGIPECIDAIRNSKWDSRVRAAAIIVAKTLMKL
ncbi:uncharacterized protein MONOS_9703 [Monocercomonoides exilis]|uniref:uncharacterized protein n=1 Tax=Monocercomonoides exilis TaxID=2049356 RepID=UPI0035596AFF|nr:hypothetical protein MONOS_9703 [Monocercomonoides exilis]|eukprot:MONOS_9703.1-p1 / transcript=MONOS_9703.1 / gene=MONOS_9703 / organism=Monocercomonoides_exilis_PA203 / gene_product=unspecified product / transcript_product=unspecified product / location=Mono_scaffold00410:48237-50642(+) / protein_length=761 / sequence_SO=supercontig / SO=protein_coding / is_pseudo=false